MENTANMVNTATNEQPQREPQLKKFEETQDNTASSKFEEPVPLKKIQVISMRILKVLL
jgi:hypothetical protein